MSLPIRPRPDVVSFVLLSLLFIAWPGLDLVVSGWFYDPVGEFFLEDNALVQFVYKGTRVATALFLLGLIALLIYAYTLGKRALKHLRSGYWFLLISLLLGPGVIVHNVFKDNWGRARPHQTSEFGGDAAFTRAWVPTDQCERNCSFVSGHSAMGYYLAVFALIVPRERRRRWLLTGIAAGSVIGLGRIVQGGHFLSDVVLSFYFVWFTALAVRAIMRRTDRWPGTPDRLL